MDSVEWREGWQDCIHFKELLQRAAVDSVQTSGVAIPKVEPPADPELQRPGEGRACLKNETEAEAARSSGNEAYQARFLYVAWQEYARALLSNPNDATVYANRAQVDLQLARQAQVRSPNAANGWFCQALQDAQQAWLCLGGRLTPAGVPDWTSLLDTPSPVDSRDRRVRWKVCLRLAEALRGQGRLEEAREALTAAQYLKPRSSSNGA
jgi:tetratricopeptide (TPR) repeat protein